MYHATLDHVQPDMSKEPAGQQTAWTFDAVYEEHFAFVWRSLRYLGVPESCLDDAVQEVFVVVHRRLGEFEGRSTIATWLFSIVRNMAHYYRRTLSRRAKYVATVDESEIDAVPASGAQGPLAAAEARQAANLLSQLLEHVDEDKRALFALVELEQMSVGEAAEVLGINVNTAQSRLKRGRKQLQEAVRRYKAQTKWRNP